MDNQTRNKYNRGKGIWAGLLFIVIGGLVLIDRVLQQRGFELPFWILTWPTLLIGIGLVVGLASGFRNLAWLILVLIGGLYLTNELIPGIDMTDYMWPICIIGAGLILILGASFRGGGPPPGFRNWRHWKMDMKMRSKWWHQTRNASSEDEFIDSTAVFGAVSKKIFSKNFNGGQVTSFMGGCEIDLTQADINGTVTLEITQVFGGTKLMVPPHWVVRSDMIVLFGGIDDKRDRLASVQDPSKILVLKGTTMFGGIEIRSF